MKMAKFAILGVCSRHPRRYILLIVFFSLVLFFWQINFVHFYDGKGYKHLHLKELLIMGPGDHDHVHVKQSPFSLSGDYVEVPDVGYRFINTTTKFKDISTASRLCDKASGECKGFLAIKSRYSISYVFLRSLSPLRTGNHKLYLKREFVSDVSFKRHPKCAVQASVQDSTLSVRPGCRLPNLDPFDHRVKVFIRPMEPLRCHGKTFTSYKGNELKLVQKDAHVSRVTYQPIRRNEGSDDGYHLGDEKVLPLDTEGVKLDDDFVQVTTYFENEQGQINYHAHVSPKKTVLMRERKDPGIPLNMIILGMDGNSDANVQRLLPDTYKFLKDELKAFIFKGFSLLGEATTPQLTGMLTGKSLEENCALHEARKGVENAGTLDEWPFIFKSLKEHGYVTMFSEDAPTIGAFSLRLNGFTNPPCDHYGRPFWFAIPHDEMGVHENCYNGQAQHMLQLDYLRSFMTSYPNIPKFGFTFLGSLCHQSLNMVSSGAKDIYEFLRSLQQEGRLNETMLVVFGDHGARFETIRATLQGKIEERLPFLSITLPEWFKRTYPNFVKNLQENTQRIISPLDIHATFMHVLKYPHNPSKSSLSRGTSLFEELPPSRECKDAGVPEHFCPCVKWRQIPGSHSHVQLGALLTTAHINELLSQNNELKSKCHALELDEILSAVQEIPNKKIRLFKGIKNGIGLGVGTPMFHPDDNIDEEHTCKYQIQFRVRPSMGLFESSVYIENGRFKVSPDISRVNRYGTQPDCIKKSYPYLRKFCLCRH